MAEQDRKDRGIYGRFKIERTDGQSARGRKHEVCSYFVLDLTHDPHAIPAVMAYAESCEANFPKLAAHLRARGKRFGKRLRPTDSEEPKDGK